MSLIDNPILTTFNVVQEPDGLMFPDVYICPPVPYNETKLTTVYEANEKADIKWLDIYSNAAATNGLGNVSSQLTKYRVCVRWERVPVGGTNERVGLVDARGRKLSHSISVSRSEAVQAKGRARVLLHTGLRHGELHSRVRLQ